MIVTHEIKMPGFQIIKQSLQDGIMQLTVRGHLDAHSFERLDGAIEEMFERNTYQLIVDLSSVDYISSAGAGAIGKAHENDGNVVLLNPSPNVQEVFDLLGLSPIFTFRESREEAVRALG